MIPLYPNHPDLIILKVPFEASYESTRQELKEYKGIMLERSKLVLEYLKKNKIDHMLTGVEYHIAAKILDEGKILKDLSENIEEIASSGWYY